MQISNTDAPQYGNVLQAVSYQSEPTWRHAVVKKKLLAILSLLSLLGASSVQASSNGVPRGSSNTRSVVKYCENEIIKKDNYGLILYADCYANNGQLKWGSSIHLDQDIFGTDAYGNRLEECRNIRLKRGFLLVAACKNFRTNGDFFWQREFIDLNRLLAVKADGSLAYYDEVSNPRTCTDPEYFYNEQLSSPRSSCRSNCECDGARYCDDNWCKNPDSTTIVYPSLQYR